MASGKDGDDPQVQKAPAFPDDTKKQEERFRIEKITYIPKFEKQKKLQVQPYELWYDQVSQAMLLSSKMSVFFCRMKILP